MLRITKCLRSHVDGYEKCRPAIGNCLGKCIAHSSCYTQISADRSGPHQFTRHIWEDGSYHDVTIDSALRCEMYGRTLILVRFAYQDKYLRTPSVEETSRPPFPSVDLHKFQMYLRAKIRAPIPATPLANIRVRIKDMQSFRYASISPRVCGVGK